MPESFPFWDRAACLAGLMILGAGVDLWRHGRAATRHKEYAFICLTGLIGCLAGTINDLITSTISPDYFTAGKGLPGGEDFKRQVAMFGLRQGLSAGVIAGAVCLYVSRRKSKFPPLTYGSLLGLLWMPMACGLAGALLLPRAAGRSDPAGLALKLDGAMAPRPNPSISESLVDPHRFVRRFARRRHLAGRGRNQTQNCRGKTSAWALRRPSFFFFLLLQLGEVPLLFGLPVRKRA